LISVKPTNKSHSSQWDGTQRLLEKDKIKRSSLVPESDITDKVFVHISTRLFELSPDFIQVHISIGLPE